jgi:hypothetical protein
VCTVSIKDKLKHRVRLLLCRKYKIRREWQEQKQSLQEIKEQRAKIAKLTA